MYLNQFIFFILQKSIMVLKIQNTCLTSCNSLVEVDFFFNHTKNKNMTIKRKHFILILFII